MYEQEKILGKLNQLSLNQETFAEAMTRELFEIKEVLVTLAEHKTIQQVIAPSEVKSYLKNGWRFVSDFADGNMVVVEIDERERR